MTIPSAIIITALTGFYNKVVHGWIKLTDATIYGDGFTVTFYRLFERTIDPYCDALNGWYSIKTNKFLCELTVDGKTKSLTVNSEEKADKLFEIFNDFHTVVDEEGTYTAKEQAEAGFNAIYNFING